MKKSFGLNMTVSHRIKKVRYDAIYSVVKEMIQMCDMKVVTGAKFDDFTNDPINRIITGSIF